MRPRFLEWMRCQSNWFATCARVLLLVFAWLTRHVVCYNLNIVRFWKAPCGVIASILADGSSAVSPSSSACMKCDLSTRWRQTMINYDIRLWHQSYSTLCRDTHRDSYRWCRRVHPKNFPLSQLGVGCWVYGLWALGCGYVHRCEEQAQTTIRTTSVAMITSSAGVSVCTSDVLDTRSIAKRLIWPLLGVTL